MPKATGAYAAKRALFDYLATLGTFTGTTAVQLQYSRDDRRMEPTCVYGGGARFVQSEAASEGSRLIVLETITIGLYIRVLDTSRTVRETDIVAETIADAITAGLAANPQLDGAHTWIGYTVGQADYAPNDDAASTSLAFQVQVQAYLT